VQIRTDFINLGNTDYEVLAEYITANSPINLQIEGRITYKRSRIGMNE